MNWKKVKVGDFLIRVKDLIAIEKDNEYSLVTIKLYHKGVQLRKKELGANISADKMSRLKAGQFILSGIDARNGAFGIVPSELDGAVVTNDFWHFDIDESIISKEYFLWLTSTPFFDDICKKASDGTTNRIRLQADRFYTQELVIPSIENQHEVVVELKNQSTKIFTLQNAYTSQLTQLDSLNQAILQEAVQGKLVPQDPTDEPASELLKRIKAEKAKSGKKEKPLPPIKPEEIPFEIPENWVWCKVGEVSNSIVPNRDKPKTFTGNIPWITQSNFSDDSFHLNYELNGIGLNFTEIREYNCRLMPIGSVIMSCVGQFDLVCVIERDIVANQQLHCFIPYGEIEPMYLCYSLKLFSKLMEKEAIHTTIKYINKTKCESILLPLPPLSEQKRIVAEVERQMAKTKQLKEHVLANQQATEQLLKALLHQAFEGEAA